MDEQSVSIMVNLEEKISHQCRFLASHNPECSEIYYLNIGKVIDWAQISNKQIFKSLTQFTERPVPTKIFDQ